MGVLDDAIREHLDLRRAHGAPESEIARKRSEALSPARRDAIAADAPGVDFVEAGAAAPAAEATTPEPAVASEPSAAVDAPTEVHPPPPVEDEATPADEPREGALRGRLRPFFSRNQEPAEAADESAPDPPAASGERGAEDLEESGAHAGAAPEPDLDEPTLEPDATALHAAEPDATQIHRAVVPEDTAKPPAAEPDATQVHTTVVPEDEPDPDFPRADPEDIEPELLAEDVPSYRPPDADPSEPPAEPPEEDVLEETPDFLQETPEHDKLWFEQKPPRDFDFDD